jgi:hypothetical protein
VKQPEKLVPPKVVHPIVSQPRVDLLDTTKIATMAESSSAAASRSEE